MKPDIQLPEQGLYLALGGGAARGLAHLGILKALEEEGIAIAGICGTSMGALIGSGYALAPDAAHLIHDIEEYIHSTHYHRARYSFMRSVQKDQREKKRSKFVARLEQGLLIGRAMTTGSIITFDEYREEIHALVPNKTFRDTKIPFFAIAADLIEKKEVVFNGGFLRSAIMASAAIPGAFPPVRCKEAVYIDGGWFNKVPVAPLLSMGAKKVLAVDVYAVDSGEINTRRGFNLMTRANKVTEERLSELQSEPASVLWRPPVGDLHWAEFTQVGKAVAIGYKFAKSRMSEIHNLMMKSPPEKWWVRQLRSLLPPDPPRAQARYPFQLRQIWDVSEVEDIIGEGE